MSYDITLCDPKTGSVIELPVPHSFAGGTYQAGGTNKLYLNVTYNYSPHFQKTIDVEKGIRKIYGLTGAESIPILESAIHNLSDDTDPNYWKATEGNAKIALNALLCFAKIRPDGIWQGD